VSAAVADNVLMKKENVIYWTSTLLVCSVMIFSIVNFNLARPLGPETYSREGAFAHLKLPDYLRLELTVAKTLGVLALLVPGIPIRLKGFAYCGFAITLFSASFAHFSVGDTALYIVDPLIFLGLLAVSYVYWQKRRQASVAAAHPTLMSNG
jgi:hypothetical protein